MTANNAPPRAAIPGLTFGYRSETGPHRQINEDFVGYFVPGDQDPRRKQGAIFAVADGMGGHLAGEVASRQAVEGVIRAYYTAAATPGPAPGDDAGPALVRAFEQTNHALHTLAQSDPRRSNMGTTLVAAIIREGKLSIANVGDSRAYLLRGGRLTQITRDHSLIGEQVQGRVLSQAQARKHPYRHIITRALGTHSTVQVDLFEGEWQAGDSLLLCTDGLSGTLSARRMARLLRRAPSPQQAADQLVSQAEAQGSRDNISALVVRDGQFRQGGGYSPYLLAGLMGLLGLCLLGVALLALLISGLGLSGNPVAAPQMAPIYYESLSPQEAFLLIKYTTTGELRSNIKIPLLPQPNLQVELWPTEHYLFLVGQAEEPICDDLGCAFALTMAGRPYQVHYQPDRLTDQADPAGRMVRVLGLKQGERDAVSARLIDQAEAWWAWWRPPWVSVYQDYPWGQPVWVYGTVDRDPNGLLFTDDYPDLAPGERVLVRGWWEPDRSTFSFQPDRIYCFQEEEQHYVLCK